MQKSKSRLKNAARKVRHFGKRLTPRLRQIRTSKDPVRIVFVCPEGITSQILAVRFSEALKKEKIPAVTASSTAIYGKIGHFLVGANQISEHEVRKALANADIISHAISTPGPLSRLRQLAPGCIITGPSYYSIGKDFSSLLKLIRKNFKLKK